MPRQRVAKVETNVNERTLAFDFVTEGTKFVASLMDIPEAIRVQLTLHGLKQKLADSYAGDVPSAHNEVASLYAQLRNGVWSDRGERGPQFGILAEALATLRPKEGMSMEDRAVEIARQLEDTAEEKVKALRASPVIKAAMEKVKLRRQQAREKAAREAAKAGTASNGDDVLAGF